MPPRSSIVRARFDAVIAAMQHEGVWDVVEPHVDVATMGAFGTHAMAFAQWLRWVFVPNVEKLIASDGPWPSTSSVAMQAMREGDTDLAIAALVPALSAFDTIFGADANELARRARAALDRGAFDEATEAIADALAAEPRLPNGENLAGWIAYARPERTPAQLDDAIAHFRRAIARAPDEEVAAITNLATALVAAGRPGDAIAALEPLAEAGSAVAHNWLGWWLTENQPDLPRALVHLEAATTQRPTWGVAWSNFAKALDAHGELARACAAFSTAIDCGDAHDEPFARDRRVQLEIALRARGDVPPPPPASARADSAAIDVLAAAATHPELSHGRVFPILPTTSRAPRGESSFAVICIAVDGRTSCAMMVIDDGRSIDAHTQARGDDPASPIAFRRTRLAGGGYTAADHLAAWRRAQLTGELAPIDAALALRATLAARVPSASGWWPRVTTETPAALAIVLVGSELAIGVHARAGGGVIVELLPDAVGAAGRAIEAPTVAELGAQLPAIIAATQSAIAARDAFAERACGVRNVSAALVAALRADEPRDWRAPQIFDRYPRDYARATVTSDREPAVAFELSESAGECAVRLGDQRWIVHSAGELPTAELVAAARAALAQLRAWQIGLHDRLRVIAAFGPFAIGDVVELVGESFHPRTDARAIVLRNEAGARVELSDDANYDGQILAAIHRYVERVG
jgi:uncharacterized protein YqcC (DUF446 family)